MHSLRQDFRYALHTLRRAPGFALIAILTLALGIGATTSIFSVMNGVVLRPLPFPDADELVQVHTRVQGEPASRRSLSPPNFASLREQSRTFAGLSALLTGDHVISGVGEARTVESARVSAEFFPVLGVQPAMGRGFRPGENDAGSEPVAVISHSLWREQLDGDANVLGRRIMLDGTQHLIVGVMPEGFAFPEGTLLWVPLRYDGAFSSTTVEGRKSNTWIPAVGRLRPGLDIAAAQRELDAFSRELERTFPASNSGVTFVPASLHAEVVGAVRQPLAVLFGAVALVLVIACTNIAGLLLARAATRREEIAIRGALGANRARIVQQLLTESAVLGIGGGVLGILLAWWAIPVLVTAAPAALPRLDEVRLDVAVLAFALGATLIATLIAGLLPALRATDGRLSGMLRSGGRTGLGSVAGQRVRGMIVVGQLALAVVLLSSGGLLLRSFGKLMSVDPGFVAADAVSFRIEASQAGYPSDAGVVGLFDRMLAEIRAVPGVQTAGAVSRLPLASSLFTSRFRVDAPPSPGAVQEASIAVRSVTPDYFAALGTPIRRGRVIEAADRAGAQAVVVINQTAARRFFPSVDPIGQRMVDFSYDPIEEASNAFTVVGVVGDVRHTGLDRPAEPEAYFAHAQVPLRSLTVVVRTGRDPATVLPALRESIVALDPNLPSPAFTTLDDVVAESVARTRFVTTLFGLFAALALGLAALGLFGLLSFNVAQRTREFGIRMALGADATHVMALATGRALALVGAGLALGIVGAALAWRMLEGMLFGVERTDPITFAGVALVLVVTGLVATWLPARRAASVDPVISLRQE